MGMYSGMDSDEFYIAVDSRPRGMTVHSAIKEYSKIYECSVDPNSCESIQRGIYRFYNDLPRIRQDIAWRQSPEYQAFLEFSKAHEVQCAMKSEEVIVESKPVEPVVTPEVITSTPSMKVGDIVIANWNIADTPGLNGQVVKILVFEGDQACVKDPSGTISVFNVKNLQPIPKDF